MAVRIVTDSTADLPKEVADLLGITVVPCEVKFGTEVYRDGVDIRAEEFYQRLATSSPLPTTSQPSVGAFLECYQRLVAEGEPVVSLHVSAKLSGTFNSALQARNLLSGRVPIEVVDSEEASIALGLVAMAAAEVAATGAGLEEVVEATRNAVARARLFFVLDTLEYLQKGGRIGRAQAFLGSVLSVKPILEVREGEVMPLERTRNRRKAVDRVCSLVEGQAPLARLAVVHTTSPQEAEALAQRLTPLIAGGEVLVSQVGPVVGTYTGPGCLGVGLVRQG